MLRQSLQSNQFLKCAYHLIHLLLGADGDAQVVIDPRLIEETDVDTLFAQEGEDLLCGSGYPCKGVRLYRRRYQGDAEARGDQDA